MPLRIFSRAPLAALACVAVVSTAQAATIIDE